MMRVRMTEFANPVIDIHLHWCAFGRRYEGVVQELAELAGVGYEVVVFYPLPGLGASPEKVRDLIPGPYLDLTGIDSRRTALDLSLIHISEPTRRTPISYAVF